MISLFIAISLVYLSGAPYKNVILFALAAPLTYVSTSWIKNETLYQFRLIPVIFYCLCLPSLVDKYVTSEWVSIGFLAATASLSASMFHKKIYSYLYILFCAAAQLYVAKSDLTGVSDTSDTLLLNSYFSTLWIFITGIASVLLVQRFYSYVIQLDTILAELESDFWNRSQSISRINLKDYINLKLHGTILNTLIVAQKMPGLASREAISSQLISEITQLENYDYKSESIVNLKRLVMNEIDFGRLQVEISNPGEVALPNADTELIIELIREVILNIQKHTISRYVNISIDQQNTESIRVTILENLSEISDEMELEAKAERAMDSKSIMRLCKETKSTYYVNSYSTGSLLHLVTINLVDRDLNLLSKVKEVRKESLSAFVNNISLISTMFAALAIPGFFKLDVAPPVTFIIMIVVAIHAYLLRTKNSNPFLISLVALLPLTIIPYELMTLNTCANLGYLPWAVNSFLGAVLFGAYASSSRVVRWVPGFFMIAECLVANILLPSDCSTLLNGTTPGFAIALVLARYLVAFRTRNSKIDAELDNYLNEQSRANKITQERVNEARSHVISKVHIYAEDREQESARDLSKLINLVRGYLLCSEKFDNEFFKNVFDWLSHRYEMGLDTSLEVYEINESQVSENLTWRDISRLIDETYSKLDIHVILTFSETLSVEIRSSEPISEDAEFAANSAHPLASFRFSVS